MPGGGRLKLAARVEGPAEAQAIAIAASDTGVGMSTQAAAHAFEPYYSTKDAGVGLGLALVRRIVEGHGGEVALESAPDRGTKVTLRLPVRAPVAEQPVAAPGALA